MNPAYFAAPAITNTATLLTSEVMEALGRHRDVAVHLNSATLAAISAAVLQLSIELLSDHLEQACRPAPEAEPLNADAIEHLAAFQTAVLRSCGEPCHAY